MQKTFCLVKCLFYQNTGNLWSYMSLNGHAQLTVGIDTTCIMKCSPSPSFKGSMPLITFCLGPFYYQGLNPKKRWIFFIRSFSFDHCILILKTWPSNDCSKLTSIVLCLYMCVYMYTHTYINAFIQCYCIETLRRHENVCLFSGSFTKVLARQPVSKCRI